MRAVSLRGDRRKYNEELWSAREEGEEKQKVVSIMGSRSSEEPCSLRNVSQNDGAGWGMFAY